MKDRPRQYATAAAFRVALETRLKSMATAEGADLQRLRRQVSFDRLLARLFKRRNASWLLKGGYAMELRLQTARTTKDIDISLPADAAAGFGGEILTELQRSARANLEDFFEFTIAEPQMNLDAAPQGGARYPVATSADSTYSIRWIKYPKINTKACCLVASATLLPILLGLSLPRSHSSHVIPEDPQSVPPNASGQGH